MKKISHHKTFTSAKRKLARLQREHPERIYAYRVNEEASYMPHVIYDETHVHSVPRLAA